MTLTIDAFTARWTASGRPERANCVAFLNDLCDIIGVPHPDATNGYLVVGDWLLDRTGARSGTPTGPMSAAWTFLYGNCSARFCSRGAVRRFPEFQSPLRSRRVPTRVCTTVSRAAPNEPHTARASRTPRPGSWGNVVGKRNCRRWVNVVDAGPFPQSVWREIEGGLRDQEARSGRLHFARSSWVPLDASSECVQRPNISH